MPHLVTVSENDTLFNALVVGYICFSEKKIAFNNESIYDRKERIITDLNILYITTLQLSGYMIHFYFHYNSRVQEN